MDGLVMIHSQLRWLVLLAGVAALGVALMGLLGSGLPERTARQVMLAFTTLLDVQVLLGIVLWVQGNYWQSDIRQFRFEHPIMMALALVAAHITAARARRATNPVQAARSRALGSGLTLLLLLAGIPWNRL